MEHKSEKPREVKTPQNPVVPQDESPLTHPDKTKKDIENDKKQKETDRIPEKGHELI